MKWIDRQDDLKNLIHDVQPDALWIDTEYDNQRYFSPRLALVQIAWSNGVAVLDPLEVDLSILNGWGGAWYSHDGTHDWLLLAQAGWRPPSACLDTQIAARLLGYERFGLAALVEDVLGVAIDKTEQRSDWLRRPLTDEQRRYAEGDVVHLRSLTAVFEEALSTKALETAWAEESAHVLARGERLLERQPKAFTKIKDLRRARPEVWGRAQAILAWRFEQAKAQNIPEFRVMNDHLVARMAWGKIRPRDRSLALALKAAEPCPWPARPETKERSKKLEKALKAWRQEQAEALPMDLSMVLPTRCIERIAQGEDWRSLDELAGWRSERFADSLDQAVS